MSNNILDDIFEINNNKYYSKQNYHPNDIILKCKHDNQNICDNLIYSDDNHNTKILNVKDNNYPLVTSRGIKKGDEIIIKPFDLKI